MDEFLADVVLDILEPSGKPVLRQSAKDTPLAFFKEGRKALKLAIRFKRQEERVLPIELPLTLVASQASEGRLSLQLQRVALSLRSQPVVVNVLVSKAKPACLRRVRQLVDHTMQLKLGRNPPPLVFEGEEGGEEDEEEGDKENAAGAAGRAQGLGRAGEGQDAERQPGLLKRKAGALEGLQRPAGSGLSGGSGDTGQGSGRGRGAGGPGLGEEELAPLSADQQHVLDRVLSGRSLFFTGCAGTGKSHLLRHIVAALPAATTFATASTGLAAAAIGGMTVNAFAGIGRAKGSREQLVRAASRPEAAARWRRAAALIIDEISMVDAALLDALEAIARAVRRDEAPFGGIQLILAGDFHQLPPVQKPDDPPRRLAFESATWQRCITDSLVLTRIFRQADSEFVRVLAQVRGGACPRATLDRLVRDCARPLDTSDGILPTKLFAHREDVDAINTRELEALDAATSVLFLASDTGNAELLKTACRAPASLELRRGAQVLLTRNLSARRGLVNGARGVVARFVGAAQRLPLVRFANDEELTIHKERFTLTAGGQIAAVRTQLPLALAWATSVHKAQGMTLDRAEVALGKAFEAGMAYVALSRVKSLEGLRLLGGINARALLADPKVLRFYETLRRVSSAQA